MYLLVSQESSDLLQSLKQFLSNILTSVVAQELHQKLDMDNTRTLGKRQIQESPNSQTMPPPLKKRDVTTKGISKVSCGGMTVLLFMTDAIRGK
jgi:hypothetical protein